jgi:hypothetical protein
MARFLSGEGWGGCSGQCSREEGMKKDYGSSNARFFLSRDSQD